MLYEKSVKRGIEPIGINDLLIDLSDCNLYNISKEH